MKRKEAALILLAAGMLSGCGDKAVSAPAPTPTEIAAETETDATEEAVNADRGNSQAANTEGTEAREQVRIIITGDKIDEANPLKTLDPAEGIIQNKPDHKYAYSYLDTFIATLQTYKYFTGADENQTADIADYYVEDWKNKTAEELDKIIKELGNQTGSGINSGIGTELLEAKKFGDEMGQKVIDGIEEDYNEAQEDTETTDNGGNGKTGTTGTTGNSDSGKTGTTGKTGNTGNSDTNSNSGNGTTDNNETTGNNDNGDSGNTDNNMPPEDWTDGDTDGDGFMSDEEAAAQDWDWGEGDMDLGNGTYDPNKPIYMP